MATIVLSAAGAALGSTIGGSVLGLSSVVIGRAVGATLGQVLDQQLLGSGSSPVEVGRLDRYRITGASEGAPVAQGAGRMRLSGQVIWATRFRETSDTSGGGKNGPKVTEYSYSVSLAIALCEGEILRVGRIWADGAEIAASDLTMRVYTGSEDQLPDPRIEAVEGAGRVPAYRGTAYVVIEDLPLAPYGNRVPQFSFEVVRAVATEDPVAVSLSRIVPGVALIPGTGEYALATTPVHYGAGLGQGQSANVNSPSGKTDFLTSLEALEGDLPGAQSTLLVAGWFGDDLRCGDCAIRPRAEQLEFEGNPMVWRVSGVGRVEAGQVPLGDEGEKLYGGAPADAAVLEALAALTEAGKAVTFYPFILMEQGAGNSLIDPWTGEEGQPVLPWRGRITTSLAPGVTGTPDGSALAEAEVAAFFGAAQPGDFAFTGETVVYSGPQEWSYRRFILHYAHLCAAAGGVEAFCIGSEMRGLTQIRGAGGSFPAVAALRVLAADVRAILGPEVKIGYAADWSEYFGYHPADGSGDVYFHLDPLWADGNIDFVGIDNYMPLSDWRDGADHADAAWGDSHAIDYLQANIEGGEGYDWYYPSDEARDAQRRAPIVDGAYGEDWIYRPKDIRNWWRNEHHERIGGVRQEAATAWLPRSKPVWFTELGCAAIDKGTNQPNRFLDAKSSESGLPAYSDGTRDDLIQQQYLRAMLGYWGDAEKNPASDLYDGPMVELARSNVWAWDTRPFPWFPGLSALWSDGDNYARGHWLNGRASAQALAGVVREICARAGVDAVETDRLFGLVRGLARDGVQSARAALQPLMLAYGFDVVEREGKLVFLSRTGLGQAVVAPDGLAVTGDSAGLETVRAPEAEVAGRVRVNFIESDGDYQLRAEEAIFADEPSGGVSSSDLSLVLTQAEGRAVAERWLAEARVARDRARFALPPSSMSLGAGDVVQLETGAGAQPYRIDRVEQGEARMIEAVRVAPNVYRPSDAVEGRVSLTPFVAPVPVYPLFLDLPLITGDEVEHAPHLAVTAKPWPGTVAAYSAAQDSDYALNLSITGASVIGVTENALFAAPPGIWDRGPALRVRLQSGSLSSVTPEAVLNGANLMAIGDGSSGNWELFQFVDASLMAAETYEVRVRLRGQLGSDALMPDSWPAGSLVVLLNGAPKQITLAASERGLARYYRVGPAGRSYDDPSYTHLVEAFDGIGLRPYAPCHLRAANAGGDVALSWIRRTRIDGDSWASTEVPLGEAFERYHIRVRDGGGVVLREVEVDSPGWTYDATSRAADGLSGPYAVEVAQMSDRFGPGLYARIALEA